MKVEHGSFHNTRTTNLMIKRKLEENVGRNEETANFAA